ncbi:MAG: MATE family efflux transporter [Alphaproteobacteria bacterium]|nr:MATE family efflux transporter [Alphaproteobacteria bacterium]
MTDLRALAGRLVRLAWPVALARLGIMGMGVADTIMVGQLAPNELSHQALGWAPTAVFLVTGIGLLMGVQVLAARALGAGDKAASGAAWRKGLVLAVVSGAVAVAVVWAAGPHLLTAFGVAPELAEPAMAVGRILALSVPLHLIYVACSYYLEALQRPVVGAVVMWAANILNIALNFWFIPEMGAEGSAWATFGARLFLAATLAIWILRLADARALGVLGGARGPSYPDILRIGAAAAVSQAVEAGAFSGMTIIAGRVGADEVAAYQILLNQLAAVFMIAMGLSTATAVIVSESIGAKAFATARAAGWVGLGLNTIAMAAAAVLFLVCGGAIASAFTSDVALAALVAGNMLIAALILAPDGGQVVAAAALRARGDNWFPTASHILAYAVVMPATAFWLAETMGRGVAGLLEAILIASVLSVGVLIVRLAVLTRESRAEDPAFL